MCKEILCDNRFELRFIEGFCDSAAISAVDDISKEKFKYLANKIRSHFAEPTKKRKYTKKKVEAV